VRLLYKSFYLILETVYVAWNGLFLTRASLEWDEVVKDWHFSAFIAQYTIFYDHYRKMNFPNGSSDNCIFNSVGLIITREIPHMCSFFIESVNFGVLS
jgi:hypothetical protein